MSDVTKCCRKVKILAWPCMAFRQVAQQVCKNYVLIRVMNAKTEQEPSLDEMAIDDSLSLMARLKKYVASDLFLHRCVPSPGRSAFYW